MFQQKALPVPIPPSLLHTRRGSLPVSQLFGIPTSEQTAARQRASLSAHGFATTTPLLYHRRESTLSESGHSSSSSSRTVQPDGDQPPRRSSFREHDGPPPSFAHLSYGRRNSLPFMPNLLPADSPLATGSRRTSHGTSSPQPRRTRLSSHNPPQRGDSLSSSSEESEEADDDVEPLPTPVTSWSQRSAPVTFADPFLDERKSLESLTTGKGAERPGLETINSDSTVTSL